MKYAYRSIAEFVKHVTDEQPTKEGIPTFPELQNDNISDSDHEGAPNNSAGSSPKGDTKATDSLGPLKSLSAPVGQVISSSLSSSNKSGTELFDKNKEDTKEHVQENSDAYEVAEKRTTTREPEHCSSEERPVRFTVSSIITRQR